MVHLCVARGGAAGEYVESQVGHGVHRYRRRTKKALAKNSQVLDFLVAGPRIELGTS